MESTSIKMNLFITILPEMFNKYPKLTACLVTAVVLAPILHDGYTQWNHEKKRHDSFQEGFQKGMQQGETLK